MDKDIKKSCKYCLAISLGIVLGMIIMNIVKDPVIKSDTIEKNIECSCKN